MENAQHPSCRILAAFDYTDQAEYALRQAIGMAASCANPELHVVRVAASPPIGGAEALQDHLNHEAAKLKAALDKTLQALAASQLAYPGLTTVAHIAMGDPADAICRAASEIDVQLIVLGTHGRLGIRRLALGSVAEAVTRRAPCSVLVCRPKALKASTRVEAPRPGVGADGSLERRHTYHFEDRNSQAHPNLPLVFPM